MQKVKVVQRKNHVDYHESKCTILRMKKKAQERVKTIGKTLPRETYISLVSSQESEIAGNRNDAS